MFCWLLTGASCAGLSTDNQPATLEKILATTADNGNFKERNQRKYNFSADFFIWLLFIIGSNFELILSGCLPANQCQLSWPGRFAVYGECGKAGRP